MVNLILLEVIFYSFEFTIKKGNDLNTKSSDKKYEMLIKPVAWKDQIRIVAFQACSVYIHTYILKVYVKIHIYIEKFGESCIAFVSGETQLIS